MVDANKVFDRLARFRASLENAKRVASETIAERRRLDSMTTARKPPEFIAALEAARADADAAIEVAWLGFNDIIRPLEPIVDAILGDLLYDRIRLLAEALDVAVAVKNCVNHDARRGADFGRLVSPLDGSILLERDRFAPNKGAVRQVAGMAAHDSGARALRDALAPLREIRALYEPELTRIRACKGA